MLSSHQSLNVTTVPLLITLPWEEELHSWIQTEFSDFITQQSLPIELWMLLFTFLLVMLIQLYLT